MCDHRLFAPQIETLNKFAPVKVVDLSRAATIAGMAESAFEQSNGKHLAVAGLSMGGIVAMEMVRQDSARVERLALLDTNHLPDDSNRIAQRKGQIERVRGGMLAEVMVNELKPHYVARVNMGDAQLHDTFYAMAMDLGPDVFERQVTALMTRNGAEDVLRIYSGRTLVLCGQEDLPCPPERHRQMAALLDDAMLEIVPDAGHVTSLENPARVNAALARWLS